MPAVAELLVGHEADAVPGARRFVTSTLGGCPDGLVEDAQLIVTELVTNASMHGTPPVLLRIRRSVDVVRLEVQDGGPRLPVIPTQNTDAMTGRGLRLVAALATSWGVNRSETGGKTVWAELAEGPADHSALPDSDLDVDIDTLLASWRDDEPAEEVFTVRLGAVPTDLLLEAKAHIDNVVREVRLAHWSDAERRPERDGGETIDTAALGFASAREQIKRQALAAAARGEPETTLVLTLPSSAADAGERYLAALDRADQFARHAQILTLETPPLHKVFRRWYVQALVDQLRARAAGRRPADSPTFLQVLAGEMAAVTRLQDAAERLELLQTIASELTAASTVDEVAAVVIDKASDLLGALAGRVMIVDGHLLRSVGVTAAAAGAAERSPHVPLDADMPGPVAVRSREALLLRNRAHLTERFPHVEDAFPTDCSVHVAPMIIDEHVLGVLSLAFPTGGRLDLPTQARFVRALADAVAQALERALAMQALRTANQRLAFAAAASDALSANLDFTSTVETVGELLVPRLADWCVVQVLEAGSLKTVGIRHFDPDKRSWAARMSELYPVDMNASTGAANVLRTGRSELYADIPDDLLAASATGPEHLSVLRELGMSSVLIVPMTGRAGIVGTVALIAAESGRHYEPGDLPFVEDVARRAALALETAQLLRSRTAVAPAAAGVSPVVGPGETPVPTS